MRFLAFEIKLFREIGFKFFFIGSLKITKRAQSAL